MRSRSKIDWGKGWRDILGGAYLSEEISALFAELEQDREEASFLVFRLVCRNGP